MQKLYLKGGALISALFITAIAVMISTALAMQQRLLIHEGELVLNADQIYLNLQGMQALAEIAVKKYALQWINTQNPPARIFPLETKLPEIKINQMILSGAVEDEQGKFNINDLAYAANQPRFIALLQAVVQGISLQQSNAIAQAITAWIINGADNRYYLSLNPAYQSSRTVMTNISELRLIAGMTPDIFSALEPYITALPMQLSSQTQATPTQNAPNTASTSTAPETPININSVSAPVLLTAGTGLTLAQADSLIICRNRFGVFAQTQEFISNCAEPAGITSLNDLTTASSYFLTRVQAIKNYHVMQLSSLLVTQPQKNNALKVLVGWQEFQ